MKGNVDMEVSVKISKQNVMDLLEDRIDEYGDDVSSMFDEYTDFLLNHLIKQGLLTMPDGGNDEERMKWHDKLYEGNFFREEEDFCQELLHKIIKSLLED